MLDVGNCRIAIIGGGAVAARKAISLLGCGATDVHVFAPSLHQSMPPTIYWVQERFVPEQLDGAMLAFAATDDARVNEKVLQAARDRGIWACRVDEDGDFITPAQVNVQAVQIAVSAGSAALSIALRDQLTKCVDQRMVKMAGAMEALRPLIRQHSTLTATDRRAIFRALATTEALDVLDQGGIASLKAWVVRCFPQLQDII